MISKDELKPCPFCGSEPQEITLNGKPLVVCWGRGCVNDPKNWNSRPIEDALNARIAELEAENAMLKQLPQPIKFWSDEKKELYRRNESRTIKSGREEERGR